MRRDSRTSGQEAADAVTHPAANLPSGVINKEGVGWYNDLLAKPRWIGARPIEMGSKRQRRTGFCRFTSRLGLPITQ